jgi:hypothetical protein
MPHGAITPANVHEPPIEIVYEPCGRRGRYNVERLVAKHGATRASPTSWRRSADCPKGHHSRSTTAARCGWRSHEP